MRTHAVSKVGHHARANWSAFEARDVSSCARAGAGIDLSSVRRVSVVAQNIGDPRSAGSHSKLSGVCEPSAPSAAPSNSTQA